MIGAPQIGQHFLELLFLGVEPHPVELRFAVAGGDLLLQHGHAMLEVGHGIDPTRSGHPQLFAVGKQIAHRVFCGELHADLA